MATYILVHGGLHGGWCWERIVPLLKAAGHRVRAPDLPGMGSDSRPFSDDPFGQHVDAVVDWICGSGEPVILVGHSQGGSAICQAAERVPDRIASLVYVTARLHRNGEPVQGGAARSDLDIETQLLPEGLVTLTPEVAVETFYHLCSEADVAAALARLVPQPASIGTALLSLSEERFGRVPRFYVEARHDRAIPLENQREMQGHWPCTLLGTLDTDHSPFYSAPGELARLLLSVAR